MLEPEVVGDLADRGIGSGEFFLCLFDELFVDMLLGTLPGQYFKQAT